LHLIFVGFFTHFSHLLYVLDQHCIETLYFSRKDINGLGVGSAFTHGRTNTIFITAHLLLYSVQLYPLPLLYLSESFYFLGKQGNFDLILPLDASDFSHFFTGLVVVCAEAVDVKVFLVYFRPIMRL
jgi:hypothetical protein